jgi:hypothetical protein
MMQWPDGRQGLPAGGWQRLLFEAAMAPVGALASTIKLPLTSTLLRCGANQRISPLQSSVSSHPVMRNQKR